MGFMIKSLCLLILQAEKTLTTIFKIILFSIFPRILFGYKRVSNYITQYFASNLGSNFFKTVLLKLYIYVNSIYYFTELLFIYLHKIMM
jgi:hypothetical protein